jgi:hypothetical protein
MKQIQFSQFDPARLFTYMLSRLVESHAAEDDRSKERITSVAVGRRQSSTSSNSSPEEILRAARAAMAGALLLNCNNGLWAGIGSVS